MRNVGAVGSMCVVKMGFISCGCKQPQTASVKRRQLAPFLRTVLGPSSIAAPQEESKLSLRAAVTTAIVDQKGNGHFGPNHTASIRDGRSCWFLGSVVGVQLVAPARPGKCSAEPKDGMTCCKEHESIHIAQPSMLLEYKDE